MNIIAMKNGKSKLIEPLLSGRTLVINCTGNSRSLYAINNCMTVTINGLSTLSSVDRLLETVCEYDTIIFYTYEVFKEEKVRVIGIEQTLRDKNVIFMFDRLE